MIVSKVRSVFYAARCMFCFKRFSVPRLSEFNFGAHLFSSPDGTKYANYNIYDDPEISELLDHELLKQKSSVSFDSIEKERLKFNIIGTIADKPDGTSDYISGTYICPRCGSKRIRINDRKKEKIEMIPSLKFTKFNSLSNTEKCELISHKLQNERN